MDVKMKSRDLFREMLQGIDEMSAQREGRVSLRRYQIESLPVPTASAEKKGGLDLNAVKPVELWEETWASRNQH